jgi:hypothetical protein
MFRMILLSQWKWSRLVVIAGTVAAFALPVLSLQAAGGRDPATARELLASVERWGVSYRLLAMALGLFVAVAAWGADHRGRHVYALVLPLPRWRYVLLRLGAGVVLLTPAVVALALGGLLVTVTATLPNGLHGYPFALTLRFALALALAYATFFAISSGTARTAAVILIVMGSLFGAQVVAATVNVDLPLIEWIIDGVLAWQGPLALFGGRWMLVDV